MPWQQLIDILQSAAQDIEVQRNTPPIACPNDGEPLTAGPDGLLFCRFDGWKWDGVTPTYT